MQRHSREIDFNHLQPEDRPFLARLFDVASAGEHFFRQGVIQSLGYDGYSLVLKQSLIFYEAVNSGLLKAAVVDMSDEPIGEGKFKKAYPVMGTLYDKRHESSTWNKLRAAWGGLTNQEKVAAAPRLSFKSKHRKPRICFELQHGGPISTREMAESEAELLCDKTGKGQEAYFHGKAPVFVGRRAYLLAKRFPGRKLKVYLQDGSIERLPYSRRLIIAANLLRALKRLHDDGIIHRDLKPDNIILDINTLDINIIDVGLGTKEVDDGCCGTREFIPPETILRMGGNEHPENFLDQQSDIYSLGIVIGLVLGMPFVRRDQLPDSATRLEYKRLFSEVIGFAAYPVDFDGCHPTVKTVMLAMLAPPKQERLATSELLKAAACLEGLAAVIDERADKKQSPWREVAVLARKVTKTISACFPG